MFSSRVARKLYTPKGIDISIEKIIINFVVKSGVPRSLNKVVNGFTSSPMTVPNTNPTLKKTIKLEMKASRVGFLILR